MNTASPPPTRHHAVHRLCASAQWGPGNRSTSASSPRRRPSRSEPHKDGHPPRSAESCGEEGVTTFAFLYSPRCTSKPPSTARHDHPALLTPSGKCFGQYGIGLSNSSAQTRDLRIPGPFIELSELLQRIRWTLHVERRSQGYPESGIVGRKRDCLSTRPPPACRSPWHAQIACACASGAK